MRHQIGKTLFYWQIAPRPTIIFSAKELNSKQELASSRSLLTAMLSSSVSAAPVEIGNSKHPAVYAQYRSPDQKALGLDLRYGKYRLRNFKCHWGSIYCGNDSRETQRLFRRSVKFGTIKERLAVGERNEQTRCEILVVTPEQKDWVLGLPLLTFR